MFAARGYQRNLYNATKNENPLEEDESSALDLSTKNLIKNENENPLEEDGPLALDLSTENLIKIENENPLEEDGPSALDLSTENIIKNGNENPLEDEISALDLRIGNQLKNEEDDAETRMPTRSCRYHFATYTPYRRHSQGTQTETLECMFCYYRTPREALLTRHILRRHTLRSVSKPCPYCSYRTGYVPDLKQHLGKKHASQLAASEPSVSHCWSSSYREDRAMDTDTIAHPAEEPFWVGTSTPVGPEQELGICYFDMAHPGSRTQQDCNVRKTKLMLKKKRKNRERYY